MLDFLYACVWGPPLLILMISVGIYLTFTLKGIQIRYLWKALKIALGPQKGEDETEGQGDINHFQSLMAALAATVGIGNIAGVATAVTVGGAGAIFWMWLTAFFGMATKYAEALLALHYREKDAQGEMCGGPMYFIEKGLGWKWLAVIFAVSGALAAFGGGNMLQANAVADVMAHFFHVDPWISALLMVIATTLTIIGGVKNLGKVASFLVPLMALLYVGGAVIILCLKWNLVPYALWNIVSEAFSMQAASGAAFGTMVQVGVSRGLMTSEAGLGTASILAAAAKTKEPGRQALVSMTGSFLSTIVMCTLTGLVLGVTNPNPGTDGAAMTISAFTSVIPWVAPIITLGLVLFAFTTILGWAYYGEKCIEYLFGLKYVPLYRFLFIGMIVPGALLDLVIVWKISDLFNGLMAFPNLIAVAALSPLVIRETRRFVGVLALGTVKE